MADGRARSAGKRPPGRDPPEGAAQSSPPPFAASFATHSPGPATQAMRNRYENATNVNRNAADTIHMSGLTSRQWPCVTFTTT